MPIYPPIPEPTLKLDVMETTCCICQARFEPGHVIFWNSRIDDAFDVINLWVAHASCIEQAREQCTEDVVVRESVLDGRLRGISGADG